MFTLPTLADLQKDPALNVLEAVRVAHAALLQAYKADHGTALRDAAEFVHQGQVLGAWLDTRADRDAVQSLLDYWSTRLYREADLDLGATLAAFNAELAPILSDGLCPYLGLEAFGETNANVFFGRQRLVAELLTHLHGASLLAVVGTSGSGKSSVVRAGLLPAMKQGGYSETVWHYQPVVVPGADPLAALGQFHQPLPPQSVVVIDQFEEIFTLTPLDQRAPFAEQLLAWATAGHKIILTLRADFEAKVQSLPAEFAQRFGANVVRVLPMSAHELREAIEGPATRVGLKFEAGLVDALVAEVSGEAAALPLLQFTLWALWQKRQRNRVLHLAYAAVGGGRQSLARAADAFYASLIPEKQEATKRLLLRMVKINENLEVTSDRIRRVDLLSKKDGSEKRRAETLDQLIAARLVRQTGTREVVQVEVAHEALVRNWPTLLSWLEEERETVRQHNRLKEQARRWREAGHDPNLLWRGVELEKAAILEDPTPEEDEFIVACRTEVGREAREKEEARQREWELKAARRNNRIVATLSFVAAAAAVIAVWFGFQASLNLETANQNAAIAEAASTQAIAQQTTAEAAKAQVVAAQATAVLALTQAISERAAAEIASTQAVNARVIAEAASTQAIAQQAIAQAASTQAVAAQAEAQAALSRQLAAQSQAVLNTNTDIALLLGIEAYQVFSTTEAGRALNEATQALLTRTLDAYGNPLPKERNSISSLAFSPDGSVLAASLPNGSVPIWETSTQKLLRRFEANLDYQGSVDFSYDGAWVMACGGQLNELGEMRARIRIWEWVTQDGLAPIDLSLGPCHAARFSMQRDQIAIARDSSEGVIWGLDRNEIVVKLSRGHFDSIIALAWSPVATSTLATGSLDGLVRVWDTHTGELLLTPEGSNFSRPVTFLKWSPDGTLLAAANNDGTIKIFHAETGAIVASLSADGGPVNSVAFSPNGRWLVSADASGTLIVWDVNRQQKLTDLQFADRSLFSVAFSPVENLIATGDDIGQVRLFLLREPPQAADPLALACELVGRNFTQEEWDKYFSGEPYQETCKQP